MPLSNCGVAFQVAQRSHRGWVVAALCCGAITLFAATESFYALPFCAWAFLFAHIVERRHLAPALVAVDHVAVGARSIAFTQARSVRARGNRVVVRGARQRLAFDVSLLDSIERALVVRHIEARILFARSGRRCTRPERSALEALYVFRATAVRVHRRTVIEILEGQGPWIPSHGIFVRRSHNVTTTAYRSNARTNAIEVGSLENEFAAQVR